MFKAHNTYYNFQNDLPEPLTNNRGKSSAGAEVKNPVQPTNTNYNNKPTQPTTQFDNAVNNIKNGANMKSLFNISSDGAKYALLGGGLALAYSLYKHKHWFVYTALGTVAGMGIYNIYNIVKPLKTVENGQ